MRSMSTDYADRSWETIRNSAFEAHLTRWQVWPRSHTEVTPRAARKKGGSLSLVISLPIMLVGFSCYLDGLGMRLIQNNVRFMVVMAAASIAGIFIGGQLLGIVPTTVLLLAGILLVSTIKIWRQDQWD